MRYISTRGNAPAQSFEEVLITGLAPDGGLYVPAYIPHFDKKTIASWKNLSYQALVFEIIHPFVAGSVPDNDLKSLINQSYSNFHHPDIAPLKKLDNDEYILELFHGPTLAFKDFALQLLGNLLDYTLEKRQQNVVIIGATSGDTGSAAIEGCKHCKRISLFMLHPHGRVSDVQRKQMTTVDSPNIYNLAVKTDFDGCQSMVKAIFNNPDSLGNRKLVAVNSINWARIMAQIVYYFYAALKLGGPEKPIAFSVPTGNFGDIYAGYIAYKMGLPISRLIVATNKNDILHRFFSANDYSKSTVTPTYSPSMDIQISSNFERLLFDLYDGNGAEIVALMKRFDTEGKLEAGTAQLDKARALFSSHSTDDKQICTIIKETYERFGYLVDPHTATGINAAHHSKKPAGEPMVILSTAHPAKFPDVIEKTTGMPPPLPDYASGILEKEEHMTLLENDIEQVRGLIIAATS